MKFSAKLALSTVTLLCVTLSIGGALNISRNFAAARQTALTGYTASHQRTCFSMETKLGGTRAPAVSDILNASETLIGGSVGQPPRMALLSPEGTVLYSNLPGEILYADVLAAVDAGEERALFLRAGGRDWVMMATPLQGVGRPLWLAETWDATALFGERDRQVRQHFVLSAAVIAAAAIVAVAGSRRLTGPLRRLEQASRELEAGNLGVRVNLATSDEIQRIGEGFNRMVDAIGSQMDELREESERQKRFVAAFSHELKTPMTAMLGYASMLEKGQLPPAQQSKAAGYIFRESARLETLSRQLMQLMQLQEGGVELAPALLAPVLKQAAADLPELPVRLETECPQEASGRINVSLLTDLIRNLVLNAASAHPKDGVVRIQCVRQGDVWVLRVSDKGRGIPPDLLERVAEPFFRVDRGRSRNEGGNGLGIALCRMIAAAHKSELHIESRVNEGTCVWMTLEPCTMEKGGESDT